MSDHFSDNSGHQITYNPTIIILDACFTALAVHILLSRSLLSDSESLTTHATKTNISLSIDNT